MTSPSRMRTWLGVLTRYASYGSALFLAAMMLVTVVDVVLRAVFNLPVTGTYDLVQLFLVGTVFLSAPEVFLREKNIIVDFSDHVFAPRVVKVLRVIANICCVGFLGVLIWRMLPPALDSAKFNEVSPDLSIPMIIHWVLIISAIGLAFPAAVLVLAESAKELSRGQASR